MAWLTLQKQPTRRRWCRRAKVGSVKPSVKRANVRTISKCYFVGWLILNWWYLAFVGYFGFLHLTIRTAVKAESDQLNQVVMDNALAYLYGFYVIVLMVPLAFLLVCIGRKKISRAVVRTRGHMCLNCGYDLRQRNADDHICPECGKVSPRRECVRLWCKRLH